jgi:hypothetical protein
VEVFPATARRPPTTTGIPRNRVTQQLHRRVERVHVQVGDAAGRWGMGPEVGVLKIQGFYFALPRDAVLRVDWGGS